MVGTAQPSTYMFSPSDADLGDLDHNYYYTWGIQWVIPKGEIITGAEIRYYNIYNWQSESGDRLWTNLLNSVSSANTTIGTDGERILNAFYGPNVYNLGYWTDPDDNSSVTPLLSYSIPSDLYSWISDGNFGFGIDPDCHYYNTGIKFVITTNTITDNSTLAPEPTTLFLLGSGLLGLAGYGRKKFFKK